MARIDGAICNIDTPLAAGNTKWLHFLRADPGAALGPSSDQERLLIARRKVAEVFCLSVDDVDPETSLMSLGVDSLVATELLNFFKSKLRVEVSYTDILSGASLNKLLERVVQ